MNWIVKMVNIARVWPVKCFVGYGWKEAIVAKSSNSLGIYRGTKANHELSLCPGLDSNQTRPRYKLQRYQYTCMPNLVP